MSQLVCAKDKGEGDRYNFENIKLQLKKNVKDTEEKDLANRWGFGSILGVVMYSYVLA